MTMPRRDPKHMTSADYLRWERVGWVRTLVASYRCLYEATGQAERDDDAGATAEMLAECLALADELDDALPDTGRAATPADDDDDEIPF